MSSNAYPRAYVSARIRGYIAVAALVLNILVQVLAMASIFFHIDLLYRLAENGGVTQLQMQASAIREGLVRILQLMVFGVTAVAFFIWLYRAYKNLKPLGVAEPRYSPGWVVACFFIPVLNVFRPFQAVQEMWRESDPETVDTGGTQLKYVFVDDTSKSLLIIFWWGIYWVSNIVYAAALYWQWQSQYWKWTLEAFNDYLIANWLGLAADLMGIIAALAAILVILKITFRQDEKNRRLAELPPSVPIPAQ